MTAMALLVPLSMLGFGRYFMHGAPRNVNTFFGYRTPLSMKNKATWEFAHHYLGKLWWITGWITLVPSLIVMLFLWGETGCRIGWISIFLSLVQVAALFWPIYPTEKALKRTFNQDGERKI